MASYRKVAQFKSSQALVDRWNELGYAIPVDTQILSAADGSPLAAPLKLGRLRAGNRWSIHPMEGWDANTDGSPTEKTLRRWRRFGESGAKLIWGGEAAAVRPDGRANPNQTMAIGSNRSGLARLLETCRQSHRQHFGGDDDFVVGLQLTHSGRFSRPHDHRLEPRIAYHHPLLDQKYALDPDNDDLVWSDEDLQGLVEDFVNAARLASEVGFQFVDIKSCHGYLLHEFLSAYSRPGPYGGELAGRSRLLRQIIGAVQSACPELEIGVRLSFFDSIPYHQVDGRGQPMPFESHLPYALGFGVDRQDPLQVDLAEPMVLIAQLIEAGVSMLNLTCGSPYYNPHWQRPAIFPPSDGYPPPEDPLVGVARQITLAHTVKQRFPDTPLVGTGYSYLQDYLPHVAQAVVRDGWIDSVGIGRMVLSYPTLPAESLGGHQPQRKLVCRTFSDCTTAPRNGLASGCYPLDDYYKQSPEHAALKAAKGKRRDP